MSNSTVSVSAFIICQNEEHRIRQCLESVSWCSEIVIVDSGSTDRTLEICREYTQRIFQRPWPGFVEQKRFALEQCQSDWVLNIDADEEVSVELAEEIKKVVTADKLIPPAERSMNGYELLRVVFYLGKWWRKGGWYPEYRLRLCRRSATRWGGEDPHEHAEVTGKTKRLNSELHHYTYSDVSAQIRSLNSLSSAAAKNMARHGQRASYFKILGNPLARFCKFYLIKRGYREGAPGLLVAILEAYYVYLKYLKLWELQRLQPNNSSHSKNLS